VADVESRGASPARPARELGTGKRSLALARKRRGPVRDGRRREPEFAVIQHVVAVVTPIVHGRSVV
jgi:hypothetical protein